MTSDPTARTLRLLSLLQTHVFWSGPELAGRLSVSPRTLRRDIDRLRDLGYPVDASPGVDGGYRLAAGAHMPPLLLDDDEAVAIAVGLRIAAGSAVEGIEETSLRALAKLEQVLPDRLRRQVMAVHDSVAVLRWSGDGATVDPGDLAVLTRACRDREEVRFDYRRRDGEESRRLVQPHQLVSAGRRWYLVAWDVRRSDWRTFRVDRLSKPALAGGRFDPRDLPAEDAATFVAAALRSTPMPHTARVLATGPLEAVSAAARWIDAEVGPEEGGRCTVELRSDSTEWLSSMVAILAAQFEVTVDGSDGLLDDLSTIARRLEQAA